MEFRIILGRLRRIESAPSLKQFEEMEIAMSPVSNAPVTLNAVLAAVRELGDRIAAAAPPPELLTRESFARLLDIGTSTLDRHTAMGIVGPKSFRLGGAVCWHRAEVLAWLRHRDHRGELHSSQTWTPVWVQLQRKAGTTWC